MSYSDASDSVSFSVGYEADEIFDESVSSLTIGTDESEYLLNQSISLTGTTSKIVPFESLSFTVMDPNGKEIANGNLFTTDGQFSTNISLVSTSSLYGTYTIVAEYSDQTTSTTFNLIENIVIKKG